MMEWQLIDTNSWVFGEKVRGIVRVILAEVYFDPDLDSREGGWVWMAHQVKRGGKTSRGLSVTLAWAVGAAEAALIKLGAWKP